MREQYNNNKIQSNPSHRQAQSIYFYFCCGCFFFALFFTVVFIEEWCGKTQQQHNNNNKKRRRHSSILTATTARHGTASAAAAQHNIAYQHSNGRWREGMNRLHPRLQNTRRPHKYRGTPLCRTPRHLLQLPVLRILPYQS